MCHSRWPNTSNAILHARNLMKSEDGQARNERTPPMRRKDVEHRSLTTHYWTLCKILTPRQPLQVLLPLAKGMMASLPTVSPTHSPPSVPQNESISIHRQKRSKLEPRQGHGRRGRVVTIYLPSSRTPTVRLITHLSPLLVLLHRLFFFSPPLPPRYVNARHPSLFLSGLLL